MAYGIEIIGNDSNGSFLVTDTSQDLVNYAIVATGTGTSVNLTSTQGLKPIVFAKPTSGSTLSNTVYGCQFSTGNIRTFKKATITYTGSNNSYSIGTLSDATMDYIVVKDMTGITYSGSTTYGVQILTANQDVAVDSRRFLSNDTFVINAIKAAGTVAGSGGLIYTGASGLQYVNTEFTRMFAAGNGVDREEQVAAIEWYSSFALLFNYYNDVSFGPASGGSTMFFNNWAALMQASLR